MRHPGRPVIARAARHSGKARRAFFELMRKHGVMKTAGWRPGRGRQQRI
jgi:hypothetical protein